MGGAPVAISGVKQSVRAQRPSGREPAAPAQSAGCSYYVLLLSWSVAGIAVDVIVVGVAVVVVVVIVVMGVIGELRFDCWLSSSWLLCVSMSSCCCCCCG